MRPAFWLLPGVLVALVACKGSSPQTTPDAAAIDAAAIAPVRDASSTHAALVEDAGAPPITDPDVVDFEDQLVYGEDAGEGDPGLLTRKTGYTRYRNTRFSFEVDVPRALTAMPAPTNGDGLQWRLGSQVSMTASGIRDLGYPLPCVSSRNVTARKETKDTCWGTGTKDGYIHWEKRVRRGEIFLSLRLQYREELKETMDPIVKHVDASWDP